MINVRPKPIVILILDGWGYREEAQANAIAAANTPNWDRFWQGYPHCLLEGSGTSVGLPKGQMGNSEVGHLTMGSGRQIFQDLTRIDAAIENGDFFRNEIFVQELTKAKQQNKAVHIMGLLSPGGVHSHEHHIYAFLDLA